MTTIINGSSPSITFSDGSTQTSATRPFLNRLINGNFVIDQRNAGASVTPTDNSYTLDRWFVRCSQASKFTIQQNAGSVTPPVGFSKYLGVTSTSAYSVASGDFFFNAQAIEGYNIADLGFGTASAKTITISFQVYSSLTGTFGGTLRNGANNRYCPFSYTVSSANTWTSISVTIAGDTTGTWATDNTAGLYLYFNLGTGSTYSGGTSGVWGSTAYFTPAGTVSVVGTSGATFYITGVQLEVGSTATSFDYRPFTTELQLAQRYTYVINANNRSITGNGYFDSTTSVKGVNIVFPVTMRGNPTITYSGTTSNFVIQRPTTSAASASAVATANIKTDSYEFTATSASASVAGYATAVNLTSDAIITVSAEL